MKYRYLSTAIALFCAVAVFAQDNTPQMKWYGFVRNFYTFDSNDTKAGTAELYNYVPLDNDYAFPTTKWSAITSRLGVNVSGYSYEGVKIGAKIEADFYSGVSGVTGTAQLRLRQAYTTMDWTGRRGRSLSAKVGQAWHPLAADMPDVIALEIGVPFNPFSRTPLVQFDHSLSKSFSITTAFLWQMQYTSNGPEGASANYQKYGNTPELYFGFNLKKGAFLSRLGADVLSIKPRYQTASHKSLDDRLTTASLFAYAQVKKESFTFKAKSVLHQGGEHLNLNGGYGVVSTDEKGNSIYTPTLVSSSWMELMFGKKRQCVLFAGYSRNFGTMEPLASTYNDDVLSYAAVSKNYLAKSTYANANEMYRVSLTGIRNYGKLALALEYQFTSVNYGTFYMIDVVTSDGKKETVPCVNAANGLTTEKLHWVSNHRIQLMCKFSF